jgi:hypothetical protein
LPPYGLGVIFDGIDDDKNLFDFHGYEQRYRLGC